MVETIKRNNRAKLENVPPKFCCDFAPVFSGAASANRAPYRLESCCSASVH